MLNTKNLMVKHSMEDTNDLKTAQSILGHIVASLAVRKSGGVATKVDVYRYGLPIAHKL